MTKYTMNQELKHGLMRQSKRIKALPRRQQKELGAIVALILNYSPLKIHFIILFGSYARNEWVDDIYDKGHITYAYESDYDILVITERATQRKQDELELRLMTYCEDKAWIRTPIALLIHDIDFVNQQLNKRQYFFADIKKEGIVLYSSNEEKLAALHLLVEQLCAQKIAEFGREIGIDKAS